MNIKAIAALPLTLALLGCDILISDDSEPTPRVAVAEMESFGITFAPGVGDFPAAQGSTGAVNASIREAERFEDSYIEFSGFDLYFAPLERLAFRAEEELSSSTIDRGTRPYGYYFTIEENGSFTTLPRVPFDSSIGQQPFSYSGEVDLQTFPEALVTFGNHLYQAVIDAVPIRATHVEFRYVENEFDEEELVNRVQLSDLAAWRRFLLPVIEEARAARQDSQAMSPGSLGGSTLR